MGCMKLDVVLVIEGGCMDYGKEVHDMEKKCIGWDGMGWDGWVEWDGNGKRVMDEGFRL